MRRSPRCQWWWLSGNLSTSLINPGNREELAGHTSSYPRTADTRPGPVSSRSPSSLHSCSLSCTVTKEVNRCDTSLLIHLHSQKKHIKDRLAQRRMNFAKTRTGNYKVVWETHWDIRTHSTFRGIWADSWECHACTLDRRSNKGEDTARANTLISCGMLCANTRLPFKKWAVWTCWSKRSGH